MEFFDRYLALLESRYPQSARTINTRERLTPLLFSAHKVHLPSSIRQQAREIVRAFFALRNDPIWQARVKAAKPEFPEPGNFSALMSYDFHIDENGQLRLIEINTNASMGLMSDLLYELQGLPNGFTDDFKTTILETFRQEFQFAFSSARELKHAVIVDEKPEQQRLFVEFLLYQELFNKSGIKTSIADASDLRFEDGELRLGTKRIDLVYNRHTDFYLEEPSSSALRSAALAKAACLSPNPHEYGLLADKARLLDLSRSETLAETGLSSSMKETIQATLIRTLEVSDFPDPDALWAERKRWFFKTKQSFGGKAAYRGSSVGRPIFQQILANSYLAQEYVPPSSFLFPGAEGNEEFKMDLRFFVYRDEIQIACARLYKGQMTNSQTPGGGIAVITWD